MEVVKAYKALGGSLHPDPKSASYHSILHLAKNTGGLRGDQLSANEAAFIIDHKREITSILHKQIQLEQELGNK